MNKTSQVVAIMAVSLAAGSLAVLAQPAQQNPMTFFVTSIGLGHGANLSGLAGADAHCQQLAAAVRGENRIWPASPSTPARPARHLGKLRGRIGTGPGSHSEGRLG